MGSINISSIVGMVKYHLEVEPIVFKYMSKDEKTGEITEIYMVKSITRPNASYNVVLDGDNWICDCKSFTFKSGLDSQGHCRHIRFVTFLLAEHVEIKVI